ncbi:hypothetical protein PTI98_012697 [Pleurotus ostreatus]|nr:hypothetical protein PTI98_012697 [Pleurotus ostreatus]
MILGLHLFFWGSSIVEEEKRQKELEERAKLEAQESSKQADTVQVHINIHSLHPTLTEDTVQFQHGEGMAQANQSLRPMSHMHELL